MRLTYVKPFLSLRRFDPIDLPEFTLVTGVNGAGKTHLLRAIHSGHVQVDRAAANAGQIRYFDWTSMTPNNAVEVNPASIYAHRDRILKLVEQARAQHYPRLIDVLQRFGVASTENPWRLARLSPQELAALPGVGIRASEISNALKTEAHALHQTISSQFGQNQPAQRTLGNLAGQDPSLLAFMTELETQDMPFGWEQPDIFQQSFGQMFFAYFELQKLNRLRRLDAQEGRQPSMPPLCEDDFVRRHGEPPWDFVNETLRSAGLDFEIDHPLDYSTTRYSPRLTKRASGAQIDFGNLSSGERILMSFAFCLYYSLDDRQSVQRPKILLFDEIDAPLHPSMCRTVVRTITETLVAKQKIRVIMTTHSPSTVAVAPDESIYVMRPDAPGLAKSGKRQAIAVLTAEIPTLSIEFEGRRQVFVESSGDAERYDRLFQILADRLDSERSLVFIAVGRRQQGEPDRDAGCPQVRRIVDELVAGGSRSVFGLVDWDQKNSSDSRVVVLGQTERYAIENCLLDPLLLAAILVRERRELGTSIGFQKHESYVDMRSMGSERLQSISDLVQRRLLSLPEDATISDAREVRYLKGFALKQSRRILEMNGHALEEKAYQVFPELRRFHKPGQLLMYVVDPVLAEVPELAPEALIDAFRRLVHAEA